MADEPATKADIHDLREELHHLFEQVDRRFDQVMDLLQAMATGHTQRFDSIEGRLDRLERQPQKTAH